ncbi:glycosyltransferase family 4 protein [Georgenia sp. 10Sc9-8]|uniref:D-inositol 3-phosphate glycosyltransferase n=1 Tax=Georgenia halotolerans TaxID=3028317 RepID=A0ABT5U1M1_9MICO|nr:glycosyltransferase family 4 protein [Georgenia halotolerans]
MRIVQLSGSSAGGVGRHVREVAGLLAAGARRPGTLPSPTPSDEVLVAGPAEVLAPLVPQRGLRTAVVEITDRPRPGDVLAARRVRRLAHGADVVHAHGLRAGALAVLALLGLGDDRPALVVTVHNLPVGGRGVTAVAAALETIVARGADVVLGVSGDLVDRMRARGAHDVERALVPAPRRLGGTVPSTATLLSLGLTQGERLVLTVGRLAPQKGLDLLCDAAALLARPRDGSDPVSLRWVVVGDGPSGPAIDARVREERLPVILAGRREDVADLYAAADVVVSTATWEGQPLAVQEALAAGAAVVATDVGGTREVTGEAAVLVPPRSARALADAVRQVLTDDDRRARLQAAARDRAAELPGPAEVLDQLRAVYERAVR